MLSLMFSLVFGMGMEPGIQKGVQAEGATHTRTYTQMKDYDYGEKNKGFYMVPDEPGQYPVMDFSTMLTRADLKRFLIK